MDDLKKIKKEEKVKGFLQKINKGNCEFLLTEPSNSYISYQTMEKKNITSNVNGFMKATSVYINGNLLNCFIPPELINTKYTILSAAANEKIYKLFFPDMYIRCFNCKEVKYTGELIQDGTRSYSRRDIDSNDKFFENVKKDNPDIKTIITFKKYKEVVDDCPIYFLETAKAVIL